VAWRVVCAPTCYGGLGVPDLKIVGFALRLRWEWLRRTDTAANWSLLPSKPERQVSAMFDASVSVILGDGSSARFWTDRWLPQGSIAVIAPHLFRAVRKRCHALSKGRALPAAFFFRTGGIPISIRSNGNTEFGRLFKETEKDI